MNSTNNDFPAILESLKKVLSGRTADLRVAKNGQTGITLETKSSGEFFAAAEIKKNYVSFHLMPVYCFPDLADRISAELKKRMQGKSCFNFRKLEPALFAELRQHVDAGIERYRNEGKL